MLDFPDVLSDIMTKINGSYDIMDSIGDLISAIGKGISEGECRLTLTADVDYLSIEVERQRWRPVKVIREQREQDELRRSEPESDGTSVGG